MTLSTTTLVVIAANSLTAMLTAALLMLVLWQAPSRRSNQFFAVLMLMLGGYCVANGMGRFIEPLKLDPARATYIATSFYGVFVVATFFFASEFTNMHSPRMRTMRVLGLVLIVAQITAIWSGFSMTNIEPSPRGDGNIQADFTILGYLGTVALMIYLLVTAVMLYRLPDRRGRELWLAPVFMICSALSAALIWPLVPIPLNAIFLAAAAGVMGSAVLRYELFNPLAALHTELASKNIELEEANHLKTQFLTNMSHELRTPLNSIIGYTQLVIEGVYGPLNDTQRDRLEKVIRNGQNLLGLINDVLDMNKIVSGRITLEPRDIPTEPLLDSVLATVTPQAQAKQLGIVRDFANAPPIFGDEKRVRQIVTNIVANAIKFTHEGSVTVRARGDRNMVRVEIEDTGIGIRADQINLVFAEFQQIDSSTTRRYEGTGLGLAITKRLVELHSGRIWLESTPDQGTTFFITLPAAQVSPRLPTPAVVPAERRQDTVLVIDNSPEAREMLDDILTSAGYNVVTAADGPEGLAYAHQLHPDLITLDIMMPGMDGWQVLRALKVEPDTLEIPVVIVSIIDNHPLALSLGAADSLTKPFDQAKLLSVLDSVLAPHRHRQPILIVETAHDSSQAIHHILENAGYSVVCVVGGTQAIRWLGDHTPSLVLLEWTLPGTGGIDVVAHVRHDEHLTNVPVIVIAPDHVSPHDRDFLTASRTELIKRDLVGSESLLAMVRRALESVVHKPAFADADVDVSVR